VHLDDHRRPPPMLCNHGSHQAPSGYRLVQLGCWCGLRTQTHLHGEKELQGDVKIALKYAQQSTRSSQAPIKLSRALVHYSPSQDLLPEHGAGALILIECRKCQPGGNMAL
jgi:hypothetical protein